MWDAFESYLLGIYNKSTGGCTMIDEQDKSQFHKRFSDADILMLCNEGIMPSSANKYHKRFDVHDIIFLEKLGIGAEEIGGFRPLALARLGIDVRSFLDNVRTGKYALNKKKLAKLTEAGIDPRLLENLPEYYPRGLSEDYAVELAIRRVPPKVVDVIHRNCKADETLQEKTEQILSELMTFFGQGYQFVSYGNASIFISKEGKLGHNGYKLIFNKKSKEAEMLQRIWQSSAKERIMIIPFSDYDDFSYANIAAIKIPKVGEHNLEELVQEQGPLCEEACLNLVCDLYSALKCLYDLGIAHRDIRPQNIQVSKDGSNPLLIDFGAAVLKHPSENAYAAREFEGRPLNRTFGGRHDFDSLAQMAYYLVTGKILYNVQNYSSDEYETRADHVMKIKKEVWDGNRNINEFLVKVGADIKDPVLKQIILIGLKTADEEKALCEIGLRIENYKIKQCSTNIDSFSSRLAHLEQDKLVTKLKSDNLERLLGEKVYSANPGLVNLLMKFYDLMSLSKVGDLVPLSMDIRAAMTLRAGNMFWKLTRNIREAAREAELLRRLEGAEHIVQIKGYAVSGSDAAIELEYIKGRTLESLMADQKLKVSATKSLQCKDVMPSTKTLKYGYDIFKGIMEMREKGIKEHRDIRPANIIIDSEKDKAVILDLGIAKADTERRCTSSRGLYQLKYVAKADKADILHFCAHGDFQHKDLHPANILFKDGSQLSIIDLGCLTTFRDGDLVSLGLIMYKMATGKHLAYNLSMCTTLNKRFEVPHMNMYSAESGELKKKYSAKIDQNIENEGLRRVVKACLTASIFEYKKIREMFELYTSSK